MWNTFEKSRYKIEGCAERLTFEGGLPAAILKEKAEEILGRYKTESVSKVKSDAISFILRNAGICYAPDSLFGFRIDHGNIMKDFLERMKSDDVPTKIREKIISYEAQRAFIAQMDFGHIAPDWNYVLKKGISGIIADLEEHRVKHASAPEKAAYYSERIAVFEAMRDCFLRFAKLAESCGTEKSMFVAGNFRSLAKNPPQTMVEALQLILIFYFFQTNLDTVIVRSLGGLDRMLYPYYKNDLESGRFDLAGLGEILKYFMWEISCMKVMANLPFYICGPDGNGADVANELTYLILEKYRELDIYDPKIHVMYHENLDNRVKRLVLDMIREGKNSFIFMNTHVISKSLENIGISSHDAKNIIVYGCYEGAAEGCEVPCTCAGNVNMAKSVWRVLERGEVFDTFDEFFEAVVCDLLDYTQICMDTLSAYECNYDALCPSMMMSPTYKDSRESAVDVYSGGAKYNNTSIVGAGFATLIDSLAALKVAVFDKKLYIFDEVRQNVLPNWENSAKMRLILKNKCPKFGNGDAEVDKIATLVYNRYADLINGKPNGRGGVFRCGMFSIDWRFWMGRWTGATPDGRFSGEPLSKNTAASVGQDKNGVTAYLGSLAKLDWVKCPDGGVADVVLHISAVRDEDGMKAFEGLLDTYMKKGGYSVHFNVLSPAALRKAQREPEKYRNLQIRLCGWNVRFIDLDKAQQDEFIKQSENMM